MEEQPSGQQQSGYIEDLLEDQPLIFSTSDVPLTIPTEDLHPTGRAIAFFVIIISCLGIVNGIDYIGTDSGLVRADEFVYRLALTAPPESAHFDGTIYNDTGDVYAGVVVYLSWDEGGIWNSSEVVTDENGSFHFEKLKPGLIRVDLIAERDGHRDVFSNRVLLSPPAIIEPIGFTRIDFTIPSQSEFAQSPCSNGKEECEIRTIDKTKTQMDHPLMDSSAATVYVLIGFGFVGLGLIAIGFSVWALASQSVAILRMSTIFSFFSMGHYYSACILGLVAFLLTFAIPRPREISQMESLHNIAMDL